MFKKNKKSNIKVNHNFLISFNNGKKFFCIDLFNKIDFRVFLFNNGEFFFNEVEYRLMIKDIYGL